MPEHEYALLGGFNRSSLGRYFALAAAAISSAAVLFALTLINLAKLYGVSVNIPPTILSLLGAGTVFSAIYWLFNKYGWKISKVGEIIKVPDLSGEWSVTGQTLNPDKTPIFDWTGRITVSQSWDKIRVHLWTSSSVSDSISAAIMCDEIDGYHLIYHYRNNPDLEAPGMNSHLGFSEIIFAKDRKTGVGTYFNGHGRYTFGTMNLRRM